MLFADGLATEVIGKNHLFQYKVKGRPVAQVVIPDALYRQLEQHFAKLAEVRRQHAES